MARIRTIKPEFPQSESMGRISRDARLLFIMLWTIADDAGRARASSRLLASLLFPYDDDAVLKIPEWLMELERQDAIKVYAIDDNSYVQIAKWLDHQKIDHASPSKLPPYIPKAKPRERVRKVREEPSKASEEFAPYLVPSTLDLGMDLGPRTNTKSVEPPLAATPLVSVAVDAKPIVTLPTNKTGIEVPVFQSQADEFTKLYPALDVPQQLREMRGWLITHERERKTAKGMGAFINSWLSRNQNRNQRRDGGHRKESEYEKLERVTKEFIAERSSDGSGSRGAHQPSQPELLEADDERKPIEGMARDVLPRFGGAH